VKDRREYLIYFLRACGDAADKKQLGVELDRLMVNGDLMREAADEFERLLPEDNSVVFKDATDELHFHLVRGEHHAQQALDLLYRPDGAKRSIWFRMAIGRAQSILMSAYVRDLRLKR
jgi:hypothetical protein